MQDFVKILIVYELLSHIFKEIMTKFQFFLFIFFWHSISKPLYKFIKIIGLKNR